MTLQIWSRCKLHAVQRDPDSQAPLPPNLLIFSTSSPSSFPGLHCFLLHTAAQLNPDSGSVDNRSPGQSPSLASRHQRPILHLGTPPLRPVRRRRRRCFKSMTAFLMTLCSASPLGPPSSSPISHLPPSQPSSGHASLSGVAVDCCYCCRIGCHRFHAGPQGPRYAAHARSCGRL